MVALAIPAPAADDKERAKERTSFQTGDAWNPGIDIQSDVAMVYGIDPSLPDRLKTWTDKGYIPQVMTGVAWGSYQDYLYGRFDGKNHEDAAQEEAGGTKISHGGDVYYMVPEEPYGRFLCVGVQRAIDAGATAIYLEEPEFWVRGGYAPAFKREWKAYYGEDWQAEDSSPEARYRSGQLKYYLYKRALGQVFAFVKEYSKKIGRTVRCYVPTHSMLNYASWGIVSPESSLATLPGCDGYIAQVWTGTARTPNWYNAVHKERTFETAFFEYGSMHNLARATGRRMIFLADPIEDWPDHSWEDYRYNYEQTLVASLLWPDVTHFEVVPWPQRVFHGKYPTVDMKQRKPGEPVVKEGIPAAYATELMTLFETLKNMDQKNVEWHAAAHGVGVLVSDTLMFHRGGPNDPGGDLSHVYGMLMPLLKRGIAAEPVQLENATLKDYLKPYKVLYLSYDGQKPMSPQPHDALVKWVKAGGVLVVCGNPDAFSKMREWWNTAPNAFDSPEADLMTRLGLPKDASVADATVQAGKGWVIRTALEARDVAEQGKGALAQYLTINSTALGKAGLPDNPSNAIWLRRGPYVLGAVMDESVSADALKLTGRFLNLLGGSPRTMTDPSFKPGSRFLLLDLARVGDKPGVLASASAIRGLKVADGEMTFTAVGPANVRNEIWLQVPAGAKAVATGSNGLPVEALLVTHGLPVEALLVTHGPGGPMWVAFPNSPEGVKVAVRW
jgi:hypothetical protein